MPIFSKNAIASKEPLLETLKKLSANVMIADTDRNIVYMNEAVTSFLQEAEETIRKNLPTFSVKGLVGRNIDIFHKHPERQKQMLAEMTDTFNTTINVGGRMFDLVASPIFDKKGKRLGTFVEWKDAEQRLLISEYTALADAISKSQAIIIFQPDVTIINANENFLNAVGYGLSEIQGKHHRIFVDSAYAATPSYAQFWAELREGRFQAAEYRRLHKSGKDVWIQASYNPILDDKGRVYKIVKYATDITAQVNARMEKQRVGGMVDQNLGSIVEAVNNASRQTTSASSSSAQAATTVQTIAAAAEELNSSIQEISESMARSRTAVNDAINLTDKADSSTQALSHAALEMGGIVGIIQDIANQINLLALNATIESARAGEAGKGFAVVASEVKNLATQVAQATDKITQEINSMQGISRDVVESLSMIKDAISSIESGVTGVAGAIEEQSAVTAQMSHHMQTASVACSDVDQNLRDILNAMEISNQYTKEVQEMSKNLVSV